MSNPIEFDWNGEESSGFTVVPAGTYVVQIDELEQGTSKNGNAQLKVKGRIQNHPTHNEQKVTVWYSMLPQSGWKLLRLLDAAGVDCEEYDVALPNGESGKKVRFDGDDLIGCYVQYNVTVSKNPNTGKDKNDWEDETAYNPNGTAQPQPQAQTQPAPQQQQQAPAQQQQTQAAPANGQQPPQPQPTGRRRRAGQQVQG